jgi:hypothetical protein
MEEALVVPDGFGKYGWGVTDNDVRKPCDFFHNSVVEYRHDG